MLFHIVIIILVYFWSNQFSLGEYQRLLHACKTKDNRKFIFTSSKWWTRK